MVSTDIPLDARGWVMSRMKSFVGGCVTCNSLIYLWLFVIVRIWPVGKYSFWCLICIFLFNHFLMGFSRQPFSNRKVIFRNDRHRIQDSGGGFS